MKRLLLVLLSASAISLSTMPLALAADTSAPLLVDWTLQGSNADISASARTVSVKFILSDDSRINEPKLLVKSLVTTQMSSFAKVKEVAKSGKLVSYEAIATINVGQAPREWEWVLYPLSDELGNTNNSFGPGGVWPAKFQVFDTTYTSANYSLANRCKFGLRIFNQALSIFLKIQRDDPSNVQLSVIKFKFNLPESVIDEKLCETDAQRISENYGIDAGDELRNTMNPIIDEIDLKNAKAAEAARAASDKAAADRVAAEGVAQRKAAADKAAALKKTTIICSKGKLIKKVTGVKPKCPSGYKLQK